MILSNAPQNEAVLSNVGEIGEFRIRNSAKAFNILSSGLYANKIKAIVRELSCNAVDSHAAAGKTDVAFDVHLPTFLEPYFAIRDYGTGLNHDQVTSIYTTYFESTKTGSNDFIGALGLGSKSPFSYTDNFTVTAIKDGRKGIYTAFINEAGVPSIALMGEEETTEEAGVEVRFAVESQYDFTKFEQEAGNVYRWFKLRPNVSGKTLNIKEVEYDTKDIIPGVHVRKDQYSGNKSIAIMGNIAYPIEVPSSDKSLGTLVRLLGGNLVIEFGIGELDFQASREGLSYIPQTIESIKKKLEALNARLADFVAEEADKIENEWERSIHLEAKRRIGLFESAVVEYVKRTGFELLDAQRNWGGRFSLTPFVDDIAKFNVKLRSFSISPHRDTCTTIGTQRKDSGEKEVASGRVIYKDAWQINVEKQVYFVENDTKVGAFERAKHHWRTEENRKHTQEVFVLEPVDRSQPMQLVAFYNSIHNPPTVQRMKASTLRQKDRVQGVGIGKNVTILHMEERGGPSYYQSSRDLVWRNAGKIADFGTNIHYYIPLSGFEPQWKTVKGASCSAMADMFKKSGIASLNNITVYGVRKGDIEEIKKLSNWVNLEEHAQAVFKKLDTKAFLGCVREKLSNHEIFKYNIEKIVNGIQDGDSKELLKEFVGVPKSDNYYVMQELTRIFSGDFDVATLTNKYSAKFDTFAKRYPLIAKLGYDAKTEDIIHYINLVDGSFLKTV